MENVNNLFKLKRHLNYDLNNSLGKEVGNKYLKLLYSRYYTRSFLFYLYIYPSMERLSLKYGYPYGLDNIPKGVQFPMFNITHLYIEMTEFLDKINLNFLKKLSINSKDDISV